VFVADTNHHRILSISPLGAVSVLEPVVAPSEVRVSALLKTKALAAAESEDLNSDDETAQTQRSGADRERELKAAVSHAQSHFSFPYSLAADCDQSGTRLWVCDTWAHRLCLLSREGIHHLF
jgi:hypothetical protein